MAKKKPLYARPLSEWDRLQDRRQFIEKKLRRVDFVLPVLEHTAFVTELREVKRRLNHLNATGYGA
jgi:hypothetical protein